MVEIEEDEDNDDEVMGAVDVDVDDEDCDCDEELRSDDALKLFIVNPEIAMVLLEALLLETLLEKY